MRLKSCWPVESMRKLWTGTYTHKNVQWLSSHLLYSQANYIIQSLYLFTYFSVLETESSAWHLPGKGFPGNCLPRLQRLFKRAILFSTCTSNTFSLYLWLSLSLPRLFLCLCLCLSVSVYVSASVSLLWNCKESLVPDKLLPVPSCCQCQCWWISEESLRSFSPGALKFLTQWPVQNKSPSSDAWQL